MFEAHVLNLLKKYLGEYVRGLSIEALKISVWKGDVVLKDLQLKAEALNALKLPITVKAGFLGSVTLKVPWNKLGKEPVVVLLDRIFVLAEPLQDGHSSEKEDEEQWFEAKRRKVEDAEVAMLEAKDKKSAPTEASDERSSWLGSLIATIVGNLKISITNLHIRYEDTISNPGHPFCAGVTLATLAAVTIDEAGAETFVASGALEKLCKSLQLLRFAVYHDSNSKPWQPGKNWEDMSPQEWTEIFEEGVLQDVHEGSLPPKWSSGRQYLLHPVDGMMRYYRRGKREKRDKDVPLQELSLVLDQLSVTVSELQYCDGMKLLESVSRYRTRMPYARFRPLAAVSTSPRAWWLYGCQAVLQQQRLIWYRFSWPKIAHYCQLRRKYVQLYANCLQQSPKVNNPEIKKWDEELDVEVILLWRFLAHAKVESTRSKEAARERERLKKSMWWSLGWGTADKDASATSSMEIESSVSGQLTEEEWKTLNELMSYKPGEEASQEAPNMLQITYSITIQRSAARVLDRSKTEILCGTFVNLHVGLRLYPKTVDSDLQLQFYGLSAPEGPLLESVSREGREHALTTTFVHSPLEEHLDWKLSATMSPMHVTVWRASFDRFLGFLRSARALSPEVAFETAAALQSKFEEVTRRAQEQLQLVLEESKRFSICLDLDAPKITIPGDMLGNSGQTTQLLVDLGHFKLHTAEHNVDGKHKDGLYSRFHIVGSDISAFLADGHFDWSEAPSDLIGDVDMEFDQSGGLGRQIFPVLDRCGMSVVFDQIQVPHASSPSTRVAIQVPHVGLHFSPARYERLMCLMKAVSGVEQQNEHNSIAAASEVVASWHPRDHAGEVRVLLWGGIGSTVAEWQSRWAVLAGPYLYILESDTAQTYQRCFSLMGKQVMEIPPAGIGGSDHVIAVCSRGTDLQKVIESSSAAVMQLRTEEVKTAWLNHLTLATNKAAVSTALSLPAALGGEMQESRLKPPDQLNLFVAGSLDELQLFISGSTAYISPGSSSEERLIAELQAYGGKVDVLQRQHDMTVNIKLHSLKIEDKLQGHISPSCQYIAKSVLLSKTSNGEADDFEVSLMETGLPSHLPHSASMGEEDDEYYRDALPDFGGTSPDSHSSTPRAVFSTFASSKPSEKLSAFDTTPSVKTLPFWRLEFASLLKAESLLDQTNEHNDEGEAADFVRIKISFRESASPEYDGTDTQISIRVATLDFFCNRPTIVTLIEFGCALSEILADIGEPAQDRDLMSDGESHVDTAEPKGRDVVKGLLGRGKSRVVFRLKMDMESARIYLNKEDGSLLAMLAQEKFQMDLKVYPGSFIIAGTLGNLRVCDMLLGPEHQWGWFCDMRDPNCESLVKLEFQSFNKDDDDFEGYDYSLSGKLSAVRIVFLYRFIQEITEYFMALAMPQVQQMIMVADEVGSIGRLFQQFEMDGAPAVKLNVGLDTPVIIMPRSSSSREFMQVDLGHLQVINEFEWYGGTKEDPSAVHMDVLYAEMSGINMVVGIDGVPGKDMVQEARGLHVKVRRPLRDLLKKVAEVQVDVQIEKLSGIMSDKEYLVITDCAATNLAELPNLPPSFREDSGGVDRVTEDIAEFQKQESEQPDSGTNLEQAASSWTKLRVNVHVQHAELELYTGLERESPLARLEMQGFWLGYCVTSIQELDVYVTLPNLSVIDLRPDTKPEMRLMLGSMTEVESSYTPSESSDAEQGLAVNSPSEYSAPRLTMLVMDIRIKQMSQAVVIRVQRPRLLVVVDFLLAVGQFFVPSLGALTGQDELAADPILAGNHIRLESAVHEQKDELVCLSVEQQLIAEAHDVDEFVYDGCGHSLWLNAKDHTTGESLRDTEPFIIVGCGKKLRFRNVVIKNAHFLPEVVHLSTDSSYSVLPEDAVVLEGFSAETDSLELIQKDSIGDGRKPETADAIDFVLDVQAVAPELTFYDSTKWPTGDLTRREKLLRAKMDVNFMFASKGKDQWIRGIVKGLSFEGGSGLVVVEPLDVQAEYSYVQERTFISVFASDISMRLSFNVMRLILRFQEDAILRFNFGGDHVVSRCTHFDRIWVNSSGSNSGQQVAIWRPRAPRGYVILSDCATSGVAPPSQAVMALSNKYGRVKKPVQFELIWSSHEGCMKSGDQTSNQEDSDVCCIWLPVAPPGYVALGCVAERGSSPPSSNVVHCVHKDLVTSASISDCIFYISPDDRTQKHGSSIWRIENAAGSFFAHHSIEPPPKLSMCDLREVLRQSTPTASLETEKVGADIAQVPSHSRRGLDRKPSVSRFESIGPSPSVTGKVYVTTPQLERVWWNKGTDTGLMASIWRPIAPPGYSIVGDCIVAGLEPPGFGIVVRDDPDLFAKPVRFMPRMHAHGKGMEDAFMWFPVSPPGYVSLGCVTTKTLEKPPLDCVRCVRMNLVNQANLSARALFQMQENRAGYSCSLWAVQNQANTFIARPDLKKPPERMAYALAETGKRKLRDNISAEIKIGRLSTTIFNDLSGLMTPLVNTTTTSTTLAANGRAEALNAVVISTFAASTFNTQLEAWEPLIEPFEGIFKYESYDAESEAIKSGERIRITATSVVNLNVTSAGLDTWIGSLSAWRKQAALEQQARRAAELEENDYKDDLGLVVSSALRDDDYEKLVVENKLGCELFLKTSIDKFEAVEPLSDGKSSVVRMPPLRFPDKIISVDESRPARQFVAVHVSEVRDLPIRDDGNGQDYLCALRLAVRKQGSEQQKALPQSARSRCVKPFSLTQGPASLLATAKWNEVFIFEVPSQGSANLEVVVTNQAARAGKGEAVGVISLPVQEEEGAHLGPRSSLWNIVRHAAKQGSPSRWPSAVTTTFNLVPPKTGNDSVETYCGGAIVVSKYFFRSKSDWRPNGNGNDEEFLSTDVGLLFAVDRDGPWTSMRSILPLGTIPKQVREQQLAVEVITAHGHKQVNFRSLVTVLNNTDTSLAVAVCPLSRLNSPDGPTSASVSESDIYTEEIFENQRYQPLLGGWGNRWPGHFLPTDPYHWSNRDCSKSSQDSPNIQLPPGWTWNSDWLIDKSGHVDSEGWAYGENFQSLRWPPASSKCSKKSTFDFVRRRRLYRIRQRTSPVCGRQIVGIVEPGLSIPIPWGCMGAKTDLCVQVRPQLDYNWGRTVGNGASGAASSGPSSQDSWSSGSLKSPSKRGVSASVFALSQLAKTEELLFCPGLQKGHSWLAMDADAVVIYDDLNIPLYDWKLTVNAPLKLENRLPCTADFVVWEKPANAPAIQRQHGVVSSGGSVHVYSVDVRRPIYLTWRAQGGWRPEKDTVLISDPMVDDLPSGFWMVHQRSERKLRVSVEHDFGATKLAAKIIRIFVPYWLQNDASLPLSYRLVEIEPNERSGGDSSWLARAAKAAKQAGRRPSHAVSNSSSELRKVVRSLEAVEDSSGAPVMLSLEALSDQYRSLAPSSQDNLLSPRLGLCIAVIGSDVCSDAMSFKNFEDKMERVELKAVDSSGSYYRLSAFLDMSAERTKVVHVQPHTLFVNRLGRNFQIRQSNLPHDELLYPNDQVKTIFWKSIWEPEVISVRMEGHRWSHPFSVDTEGIMHVRLQNEVDESYVIVRTEVRNGLKDSRFLVIFRHASLQAPYRVENRSAMISFGFRQDGFGDDSWHLLLPGSAAGFAWSDLRRNRLLEILVEGENPISSRKYNIDKAGEHQPMSVGGSSSKALHVSVFQEGPFQVVAISDWKPSNNETAIVPAVSSAAGMRINDTFAQQGAGDEDSENQFRLILELAEFGLSVVDHTPEELIYFSVQNLIFSYATGLGSRTSRFKLRVDGLQIDNQLALTPMPVLFIPQDNINRTDFLLKFTLTMQDNMQCDQFIYPYIGVQCASGVAFLVNIHEPILWRLHEMFRRLNLSSLSNSQTTDVAIDPIIRIGLLNTSEIRFKVTLAMSPTQRPRGMLGFWSTLVASLGNTNEMPIRISPHVQEEVCMRQSALTAAAVTNIRNDVLSQPLMLLTGVDLLGNASSALGHMSKGVAALSMDKKFIRSRQKQESKANVEDIGDGLREGGEALAKSLFRGVTGILTKPLEGARSSGVEGFVQGVGKGLIGAAAQPMSGVLDFLSKTTEGANATRIKLAAALTLQEQLLRQRLPRVIGGDNILRPYDDYKARGQVLMQLAERGAVFGNIDLFKVRGKYAVSDAYEFHYNLPKGKTLMITHRRVILLQHPTALIAQKRPDLMKEPCAIVWDVTWNDLMTLEVTHGADESPNLPPSRLIIHLRDWSQDSRLFDSKEIARVVKCHPGTKQATEIQSAIQHAFNTYGPDRLSVQAQGARQKPARKPYAGAGAGAASGAALGLLAGPAAPIAVPVMATFGALIGTAGQAMLETEDDTPIRQDIKRSKLNEVAQSAFNGSGPLIGGVAQRGKLTANFQRIWWDKGAPWSKKYHVSIWRPIPPAGYVSVGDVVQCSYDPPDKAMVYLDSEGVFLPPEGYDLVWRDTESGARDPVTIWKPRPPLGYVSIGCVVVPDYCEPDRSAVHCVRQDSVEHVALGQEPLWRDYKGTALWHCSLWKVQNAAQTFLARRDYQSPPPSEAFCVVI